MRMRLRPRYRNVVAVTDVRSGRVHKLRDRLDNTPMTSVHVSPLGQYIVAVKRGRPPELWDFKSLLKTLPAVFPTVAGLCWCPEGLKRPLAGAAALQMKTSANGDDVAAHSASAAGGVTSGGIGSTTAVKEHLVVCAPDGTLSHFTVEGSVVRTGTKLPTEQPTMATCELLSFPFVP